MTQYIWSILQLDCYPKIDDKTQVVVIAKWLLTGTGKGATATAGGSMPFPLPVGDNFTPYEDLTEAQVIQWVQDGLGIVGIDETKVIIEQQINSIIATPYPPIPQPLPWS